MSVVRFIISTAIWSRMISNALAFGCVKGVYVFLFQVIKIYFYANRVRGTKAFVNIAA